MATSYSRNKTCSKIRAGLTQPFLKKGCPADRFCKSKIWVKKIPYLNLIRETAKGRKTNIWLVGGFLRDTVLKRQKDLRDFDFCVEKNVLLTVKRFSKKINSKIVVLDEEEQAYRVILKVKSKIYTYDFTLMRAASIHEDLGLRDFTINTLALNLLDPNGKILDYFGGITDIKKGIIRSPAEKVLHQDPLRILRGFSFMVNYGFRIEKNTQKGMVKYKKLIKNVSRERINEELFKIFSSPQSYLAVKMMDDLRIIDEVIPQITKTRKVRQGGFHHLDVWGHSLETLRQLELLQEKYVKQKKEILDYLNEPLAQNRCRLHIIKLACILHDIGKPIAKKKKGKRTIFHTHEKIGRDIAETIAKTLKISFREKEVLKKLIFWHLRPGYLADQITPTKRAIYHFFRDTEEEGVSVILLSLSDWRATRGPLTNFKKRKRHEKIMLGLVNTYFRDKKKKPLPRILDGYDIMRKFNLKPSILVGKILKKIREEQAIFKIKTKAKAYELAKQMVKNYNNERSDIKIKETRHEN
jgi:putative nucleotidyltransferase with HDIG domain